MIIRNLLLLLGLLLATLGLSCHPIVLTQQSTVIVFAPSDCKPTNGNRGESSSGMSIHVNARSILFDLGGDTELSYLFTDEGLIVLVHEAEAYSLQSYDELEATHSREDTEGDKYYNRTGKWPGKGELKMTGETATISGLTTHKLISGIGDDIDAEIWVSSDLVPARLRERMKSIYGADHWKKVSVESQPWIVDIIMLYGIPIKIVGKTKGGFRVCEARVNQDSVPDTIFQVPSGYRREK